MPVTLYTMIGSPPCAFVRSLAKKVGVELELKKLDFSKKEHLTPEYLKINPFHKVPTLDDSGFIVYESIAIAYYLLRKYAPKSELYPECVKHRTRIDQVLATVNCTIQPHKMAFFRPLMNEKRNPTSEEMTLFEENVLKGFEHLIGDKKFAVGDQLTIADLRLFSSMIGIFEMRFLDKVKFAKLRDYCERVLPEISGYDEIYEPVLAATRERWPHLT
ncbi:glutathione S-transferase 1-1-like [Rhipicephalus sanguineus]|uniref:glutathione S-transferase 1-1-like n=1 Tax=Rhipicephalus sanguineus TaxID=34632 RepID=UPI0020C4612C|nr:glutathione S-transferase 1-1-like [Rhipicephalus sanguineus]